MTLKHLFAYSLMKNILNLIFHILYFHLFAVFKNSYKKSVFSEIKSLIFAILKTQDTKTNILIYAYI